MNPAPGKRDFTFTFRNSQFKINTFRCSRLWKPLNQNEPHLKSESWLRDNFQNDKLFLMLYRNLRGDTIFRPAFNKALGFFILVFFLSKENRAWSEHLKQKGFKSLHDWKFKTIRSLTNTFELHSNPGIKESDSARYCKRVCISYDWNERYRSRSYWLAGNAG